MPRRRKSAEETPSLLDITAKLRSGACVPALREAVKSWKTGGRNGINDTTRVLLNYWFEASHAARNWCENASALTGTEWRYMKIPQKAFEMLQPTLLEHLGALWPAIAGTL